MTTENTEPFGYFRALPFGWEACSLTDEGAIALYEHPQPDSVADLEKKTNYAQEDFETLADEITRLTEANKKLVGQRDALAAEVERLRTALSRLLTSDPTGAIANASDDELRFAVNDERADPVVREQAAALLQARAAMAGKEAQS